MQTEAMIRVLDVSLYYHTLESETLALENLSFEVQRGEFMGIVGPSGCGKSTMLSLIAGLIAPSSGEVLVGGKQVDGPCDAVGYMLQRDHLFEWRTVEQNVRLGLQVMGRDDADNREWALSLLNRYGLGEFVKAYPGQLSGGMRQKVALVRTLAVQPEVLLLDEPFSALDYQTRLAVSDEIAMIIKDAGKTAILVTHDIAEATVKKLRRFFVELQITQTNNKHAPGAGQSAC